MTSMTWRDIPRQWRDVGPWLCAVARRFWFGPQSAAEAVPVVAVPGSAPVTVQCTACPVLLSSTGVDGRGRCVSCSAVAAAREMVLATAEEEAYRLEGVRQAVAATRGAGAPPRLPDEPAPRVPFAAHADEVLAEVVEEDPAAPTPEPTPEPLPLPLFDFLALGTVAASTDEDDAILNAQILLAEHHDVDSIVAGFQAYVAAHPLELAA